MSTLFTLKSCVKVNKSLWTTFCWQNSKDITSAYYCLACVKRNYLSLVCCVTCRSCWQKHVVASEFQLMLRAALISLTWRVIVRTDAPLSSVAVNTCFQLLVWRLLVFMYIVQCEPVYNESRHALSTLRQLRIAFGDKCQAPCSSRSPLRLFSVGWTTVTACWSDFRDISPIVTSHSKRRCQAYLWNPPLKTQDRTQWKVWGYEDPNSQKCTKKVHTVSILKLLKPVLYVLLPGRIPYECRFLFVTVSQQLETVVLFSLVSLLTVAVLLHITYYMVACVWVSE